MNDVLRKFLSGLITRRLNIHDIYETEDSELWLASVGMGIVRARIGGTPDHPVLEKYAALCG